MRKLEPNRQKGKFGRRLGILRAVLAHLRGPDSIRFMRDCADSFAGPPAVTLLHRPREGGGSLLLATFATIAFAETHGYRYVHRPFTFVLYRPKSFSEEEFLIGWNDLVPLTRLYPSKGNHMVINLDKRFEVIKAVFGMSRAVFHSDKFRTYVVHHHPELWEGGLEKVRRGTWDWWSGLSETPGDNKTARNTCRIHVRRDDINPKDFPDRFATAADIRKQINHVRNELSNATDVILHCSSRDSDLLDLESLGIRFDFSEDPFATFMKLASASSLVVAKSTFSICAGLLSEGVVFYPPQGTELPLTWRMLPTLSDS